MLMKTKHLRCLLTTAVVQLVILFELTESKCKFSGNPGVERIKETNQQIVAISWRGAVKDGKDEEYIVEFCRKQASYYILSVHHCIYPLVPPIYTK